MCYLDNVQPSSIIHLDITFQFDQRSHCKCLLVTPFLMRYPANKPLIRFQSCLQREPFLRSRLTIGAPNCGRDISAPSSEVLSRPHYVSLQYQVRNSIVLNMTSTCLCEAHKTTVSHGPYLAKECTAKVEVVSHEHGSTIRVDVNHHMFHENIVLPI